MNPVRFFVLRPVTTWLLAVGVLAFGIGAWTLLPVAALPEVEYPIIDVAANMPGANPETMATAVAAPLEKALASVNGLVSMDSTSQLGATVIRLGFELGRDIDLAAIDVQAALSTAAGDLPKDMPSPPYFYKDSPADRPMVVMAFTSETMPLSKINHFVETVVVRRISKTPGVSRAQIADEQKYAIRVRMNPIALAARGLSPEDVRDAIQRATLNRPKGKFFGGGAVTTVDTNDQLFDADGFREIVMTDHDGRVVRLKDVADVEDAVANDKTMGWYNGEPAIIIAVFRRAGANIVQAVGNMWQSLAEMRSALPPAIAVDIVTDRAETISASLKDIEFTLILTIFLVAIVIVLFLRNVRSMLIPLVTIPLSLLATFIVMYALGFTLNNLSLMALAISVGFVVDDAIIVVENVMRHIDKGEPPIAAAIKGGGQVAFTILSITLSLVAVFIPVFFMGGIVGRLFREFAATVSIAILASALIALSLSPMMCGTMLRPATPAPGRFSRSAAKAYDRVFAAYRASISWVLNHPVPTLLSLAATVTATGYLYVAVPKGFFPPQDNGRIFGLALAAPDTGFKDTVAMTERMTAILRVDPEVFSVTSYVGNDGGEKENVAGFVINLIPRAERHSAVSEVIERLRQDSRQVYGLQLFMQPEPEIVTGTEAGRTEYALTLIDTDRSELEKWVPIIEAKLGELPGLLDVSRDQEPPAPVARVVVDRALAARLGVDPQVTDDTLYDAFGPRKVADIYTDSNQYSVLLDIAPKFQESSEALDLVHVASKSGAQVPLSAFTHIERALASTTVTHRSQFPAEHIYFNLAPGTSLGEAVDRIRAMERDLGKPISLQTSFEGTAQEFEAALASQPWLVAAAILVVYIVLGALYESSIHPLTILSSLPSAGLGALLALMLCGHDLNVLGMIGIILLIGIVKKNAIMMVDFAIAAERSGKAPREAILEACLVRFRPIMMTTVTAVFGALPLAFATGAGSELRRPLGIAIVGGLMVSQLLTLYTTPVIHLALRRLSVGAKRILLPAFAAGWTPELEHHPGADLEDVEGGLAEATAFARS